MDQTIHTFRAREQPQPTPTNENLNPFLNKSATQKDLRDNTTKPPPRTKSSKEVSIQIRQNKRKLAEDLAATKFTDRCPNHSQEPFEFYSFTDDSLLCTKCLVTGKHVKNEVLNIKKANEKINSVLKEVINGIHGRAVNYNQWHKNLANKKVELEQLVPSLQKQVHEGIEKLRLALGSKEKELMNQISKAKVDKEKQYEKLEDDMRVLMEEINLIGTVLQGNLSSLNELNLCSYYSQKHSFIIDFLKTEESFRSKNSHIITTSPSLDNNFDLKKFQDSLKTLTTHINNLSSPSTSSLHPRDFLRLSMNSINKISSPGSGTPSATYLTPSHKEELKTLQTEASLPLTTKDTEAPISTMRQREEKSSPSKMLKTSYLEGYFDKLDKIRKRQSSGTSPMNDALSRSAQAISDTERRLQSRRKATGPSTNISEAYQRLQDSRREGSMNREKSPASVVLKDEVKPEPSSRIVVADLLAKKNPVLSPSRSFLSPTLKQRPEVNDFGFNVSGSMNKGTKSFLMENLAGYKSPDARNRSMNLTTKLQNGRRER